MNYDIDKKYKILIDILKGNYSNKYKPRKTKLLLEEEKRCIFEIHRTCIDIIFNKLIINKINDTIEITMIGNTKEENNKYVKVYYDFKNHYAYEIEKIINCERIIKDISTERWISRAINPLEEWMNKIIKIFWFIYENPSKCIFCKETLDKKDKITIHHKNRVGINSRYYVNFNNLNVFLSHSKCHHENKGEKNDIR